MSELPTDNRGPLPCAATTRTSPMESRACAPSTCRHRARHACRDEKNVGPRAVVLAGDAAYVADGTKGLKVIDISDAQTLERIGTMETTNALDLVAIGTRLFLADGEGGLKIINITRPRQPAIIATLGTTDARAVAVEGGIAVVADGAAGLRVVDVKDPSKPVLLSTFDTDWPRPSLWMPRLPT